jgi:hypothetical protein
MKSLCLLVIIFLFAVVGGCESNPTSITDSSHRQKGLALIIANSYESGNHLEHTFNDAKKIERVLKSFCFEVILKTDQSKEDMEGAVFKFAQRLKSEQPKTGLFYFMGHSAFSKKEKAFLLPTNNNNIFGPNYLEDNAVPVTLILNETVENAKSIIILDACYVNPYSEPESNSEIENNICGKSSKIKPTSTGDYFIAFPSGGGEISQKSLYADTLVRVEEATNEDQGISISNLFIKVKEKFKEIYKENLDKIPHFKSSAWDFTFKKECSDKSPHNLCFVDGCVLSPILP